MDRPLIKFFVGIKVTPDIKVQLTPFPDWDLPIKVITHEGKEYLGLYLAKKDPTVSEVRSIQNVLHNFLHKHFDDLKTDSFPFVVFPQMFLA